MTNVYDLFLNFQEDFLEFFEWNKQDEIEHIKKIPMVSVSKKVFMDLVNQDVRVSSSFLSQIYEKCEKYDLETIPYACLFHDSKSVVAIEFGKDGNSLYKSKLLLEDEEELLRYQIEEENFPLEYQILYEHQPTFFTRKEKKVKNFLEKEIEKTYQNKEQSKLQYLYLEYFDEVEEDLKKMKERLLQSMEVSLNKKHLVLYDLLLLLAKKKKV